LAAAKFATERSGYIGMPQTLTVDRGEQPRWGLAAQRQPRRVDLGPGPDHLVDQCDEVDLGALQLQPPSTVRATWSRSAATVPALLVAAIVQYLVSAKATTWARRIRRTPLAWRTC